MAPKERHKKKPTPKFTTHPAGAAEDEAQAELLKWMQEMVDWGKRVRIDIVRLEGAAGIGPGDPDDPPDEPWE
jgi:hypothetical protein